VHVLVVDDSRFMRQTITKALHQIGNHTVVQASNGIEGLARLNEDRFDLVMTDWNMPVMNGLEFVTALRREYTVPVLMITTVCTREDVVTALQAGVSNYILKPLDVATLEQKINDIFANHTF
jgi:two-component system, chemotaxis family, chemotaxis protein CheY